MDGNPDNASQAVRPGGQKTGGEITPELVSQIADRVFALLRLELKVEKERSRRPVKRPRSPRGGW
jgi:hypothetical protein